MNEHSISSVPECSLFPALGEKKGGKETQLEHMSLRLDFQLPVSDVPLCFFSVSFSGVLHFSCCFSGEKKFNFEYNIDI